MSRFAFKNRSKPVRKQSRTKPIRGHMHFADGKDDGKYFRCWNCGVICDVDREELGDRESKHGISYQIYDQLYSGGPEYDDTYNETDAAVHGTNEAVALLQIASKRSGHILMANDASGSPKTIRINWQPDIDTGCWFCGTRNWRGDY